MTKGIAAIMYRGKPIVTVKPIEAKDFETLAEFTKLSKEQNIPISITTHDAWKKVESLILAERNE